MQIPYIPVHNHLSFSLKSFANNANTSRPQKQEKHYTKRFFSKTLVYEHFRLCCKTQQTYQHKKTTRVGGIPSNVRYKKRYKTPSKRIRAPNKSGPLKSDGGILIANNQNVTVENQYNQANRKPWP
jgi:hypothetical protein